MSTYRSKFFISVTIASLFVSVAFLCFLKKEIHIKGKTMGTTYNIKVVTRLFSQKYDLQNLVSRRLDEINSSLSTYDTASEISRFNSMTSLENKFYPSKDFFDVLLISRILYELVGDVWDPSLDPIVNAWGFGREGPKSCIPELDNIKLMLDNIGFGKAVIFCNDNCIKKGFVEATIDLASIAKGFGVDQISNLLLQEGFKNFLVEIGGEVYARGYRQDGQCWLVGINDPTRTSSFNKMYKSLPLYNRAIATSGNYRNFFQVDGEIYSHIIDPRTGYPVSNDLVSVSIIASNCTLADGLATALMMLNPEDSISLVNSLPSVECLIIVSESKNGDLLLRSYNSRGINFLQ